MPLASGTEKFPVVVFGHGFVMPYSAYLWLSDSLTRNGFIVAFPTTESSISPSHAEFGKDIAFLCDRITSLNDSASSFLFGRVIKKSAAAGHSMGGGSSFLAHTYSTTITTLFNFAAAETNPSAKAAAFQVQHPALIFSGSADCIVPDTNQQRMYTNIPYACKTYINITNGLHCHFGNNDFTCVLGQATSGCNSSSINAGVVFGKVMTMLLPFLDYHLKANCSRGTDFENAYNTITGVTKQRTCTADPFGCTATGIIDLQFDRSIRIKPNPVSINEKLVVESRTGVIKSIMITDAAGTTVFTKTKVNSQSLELINIFTTAGVYLIQTTSLQNKISVKKLLVY